MAPGKYSTGRLKPRGGPRDVWLAMAAENASLASAAAAAEAWRGRAGTWPTLGTARPASVQARESLAKAVADADAFGGGAGSRRTLATATGRTDAWVGDNKVRADAGRGQGRIVPRGLRKTPGMYGTAVPRGRTRLRDIWHSSPKGLRMGPRIYGTVVQRARVRGEDVWHGRRTGLRTAPRIYY